MQLLLGGSFRSMCRQASFDPKWIASSSGSESGRSWCPALCGFEKAYVEVKLLALAMGERDEILQELVDCPDGLCELRATLPQEQHCGCGKG